MITTTEIEEKIEAEKYKQILGDIRLVLRKLNSVCKLEYEQRLFCQDDGYEYTTKDRLAYRSMLSKMFWEWLMCKCAEWRISDAHNTFDVAIVLYIAAFQDHEPNISPPRETVSFGEIIRKLHQDKEDNTMSKVSGNTHTQSQLNHHANQSNPNNAAHTAAANNHANQGNPNNSAYQSSRGNGK